MVNLATYAGSSRAGFSGAALATLAVVLPSFVIILLVMVLLKKLLKNPYVQAVLRGMKPCIAGIILGTGVHMIFRNCAGTLREFKPDLTAMMLTAGLAAVYFGSKKFPKRGLSPIGLIVLSALAGILIYGWH
jgi:chromate transporter